jgi:hypothetical protein
LFAYSNLVMFDSHWNCSTLGLVISMIAVTIFIPIITSVLYYYLLFRTRYVNVTIVSLTADARTTMIVSEGESEIIRWDKAAILDNNMKKRGWLQQYFLKHGNIHSY